MALPQQTQNGKVPKEADAQMVSTHKELFDKIKGVDWIRKDPFLKFKLREITNRWLEARHLLLHESDAYIHFPVRGLNGSSSVESHPSAKRPRTQSEESIVDVKSGTLSATSSRSSTPEAAEILPETEWECKKCTFLNPVSDECTSCAVCGCFRSRSAEATATTRPSSKRKDYPVEDFLRDHTLEESITTPEAAASDIVFDEILSRKPGGVREQRFTGVSTVVVPVSVCHLYRSRFNLVSCGQAQEESIWMDAVEKDLFATHTLDEELLFYKRHIAAKNLIKSQEPEPDDIPDSVVRSMYASRCASILGTAFPSVCSTCLDAAELGLEDWVESGVHSRQYLRRLVGIHNELVREAIVHYSPFRAIILSLTLPSDPDEGIEFFQKCLLEEPKCDLVLHWLSHVEGDNAMDRFLLPAAFTRANMVFDGLEKIWNSSTATAFVVARPPGHHCPSFEDRLIGLSSSSGAYSGSHMDESDGVFFSTLERELCESNNLLIPPRELSMGFCALNALAVAVRRFQQVHDPEFKRVHNRSIKIAIVDLDIHAGNGTELVFRNNKSVLHLSVHRYGWVKLCNEDGGETAERVMPGTHGFKDVGGMMGKNQKSPRGEGYGVNINLRKADGNAEILSSFEAIGLPVLKQFQPDLVIAACGFDGLKLSSVFKLRWGDEDVTPPGMDAEYTPSLFGYIIGRIRNEVQPRVLAATEGGYDPIGVGLAARSVHKALLGGCTLPKPPVRMFNSDWLPQLNNMWTHQQRYWESLRN